MELLLPGLILVGLMVYLSTRIKASAAAAYEPELIELDGFSIMKAQGFLHPLNNINSFALEVYAKDYGTEEARRIRHARGELTINEKATFGEIVKSAKGAVDKVTAQENIQEDGRKVFLMDAEGTENGVETVVSHKIVGDGRKVYDLKFTVLEEFRDDYLEKVAQMRDSFKLK